MSSLPKDIQLIHALRKTIRDPSVSPAITKLIESIHRSLKMGTDQHGWKTVEWRGNSTSHRPSTAHPSSGKHRPSSNYRGENHSNNNSTNGTYGSNHSFANRTQSVAAQPADGVQEAPQRRTAWQDHSDGFRSNGVPHHKYVSKFKKASANVEDTILNTILLGKLNKFSQPNYNEIKEFITHIINDGQTDMMKCFMKIVFEKAASEEIFCPLYAKLLAELSALYPVLLTEMDQLFAHYMTVFQEVVVDHSSETYQELCKRNVEKKYRRGYSQFLAELIKQDIIEIEPFMKIIQTIINQVDHTKGSKDCISIIEELADCLMKITKALRIEDDENDKQTITNIRAALKETMSERILPLSIRNPEMAGISSKARFTFLDIYEGIQRF